VDRQLQLLIDLQELDTRIGALEREAARLPREIEAVHGAIARARGDLESARGRSETTRKNIRAKEKDLEFVAAKRAKSEGRLYEVKTNKEYSAVLVELDELKGEKSRIEEEILLLMEAQERVAAEIRDVTAELQAAEGQGKVDEEAIRERLRVVEADLAGLRARRTDQAVKIPAPLLADYEKLLRVRSGLALVEALPTQTCAGCRMTIRPQALLELRAQTRLVTCESCGRYLYWRDA
jgi:predicted  nucleic acid-binding Zn-ribbon protein